MLTEQSRLYSIVLGELGQLSMTIMNSVMKDGLEISNNYFGYVLEPGCDLSNESDAVKAYCGVSWTQNVIDTFAAFKKTLAG